MRRSWVLCGLRCLVSGLNNVVARALLDKVYPSDVSIIVERKSNFGSALSRLRIFVVSSGIYHVVAFRER